ncbi:protein SUPPRESSOR OF MAX2 1-like [Magnolia sinica]|uniref:protein SUPPRESSOR OF MAX2 1-like n=1 Tax=Magnolia sinica TaxID=86752 RepID=UPI00265AD962|nr:protein SUPPRESSOR OF MAX2 1-like [Magnolia sinica]
MRAGLTTIQQTLTPEAATILNHSIAEAARRGHGQTTPLHVAATLLGSPTGYLREACIRSHPNSSHPLQCRALELCFSIALDRLQSGHGGGEPGSGRLNPPISNALMAALKRAQAHQRRGCPEQQQQPLLAVKVELEQLIISILDDPSISRVMREASFSSPAVKAAIEQSLNSAGPLNSAAPPVSRNLYMNPRLQKQQPGQPKREEARQVVDILLRWKKRNPILVGESEPEAVIREVLQMVEKKEVSDVGLLRNVQVVSLEKEFGPDQSQFSEKWSELGNLIETRIGGGGGNGLIINLGDLKWLVEQPPGLSVLGPGPILQQKVVSETGRAAVVEVAKLLAKFSSSLWLIGTATCKTYLRCQVYHPSMENDWDLQAVPIAARAPLPGLFPRLGGNGILSGSAGSLTPLKGVPMKGPTLPSLGPFENKDSSRGAICCSVCMQNYKHDLSKIVSNELKKSSLDSKSEPRPTLPQWMQNAKLSNGGIEPTDQTLTRDQELAQKHKIEELQKKWNETCRSLHPSFDNVVGSDRTVTAGHLLASIYNPNLLGRQPLQPKLQLTNEPGILEMGHGPMQDAPDNPITPHKSLVGTDLVLGCPKITENSMENTHKEQIKDLTSCIPFEWRQSEKHTNVMDADSFKRIFKGLTEKVGWQPEAASAIATTIIQHKADHGNHRGVGAKGYIWLLFIGPDKAGKKKMALALSELVYGAHPITIRLGSQTDDDESDVSSRGKTMVDRIAEAVRRNPFSVVVLENIDRADMLVQASIKRAIDKGRLMDSHGREISLGSVIFIMTTEWMPENLKNSPNSHPTDEDKLAAMVGHRWQLQISVVRKKSKRRAEWLMDKQEDRPIKPRKDAGASATLPFDLNLEANVADDNVTEGSHNSSDLTVDHDQEHGPVDKWPLSLPSYYPSYYPPDMLIGSVDNMIVFKPVDFGQLRSKVASKITAKFSAAVGDGWAMQVDSMVVERIVGGVWFGQTGFEEWADRVLVPGFQRLKTASLLEDCTTVRLLSVSEDSRASGDWLPDEITVVVDRGA